MRTLSSETEDAASEAETQPGYLVELLVDGEYLRLCSRGTVNAFGNTWAGTLVQITGLGLEMRKPGPQGSVVLGDYDQSLTAAILNANLPIPAKVWKYMRPALIIDTSDAVLIFDGVLGAFSGGNADHRVSATLLSKETAVLFSPRRYLTSELFSALTPVGTKIQYNDQKYTLWSEG